MNTYWCDRSVTCSVCLINVKLILQIPGVLQVVWIIFATFSYHVVMPPSWASITGLVGSWHVNTLRPKQNGRHFADDIFKCFSLNENVSLRIKISLEFVPKGPINNFPTLVQIVAWRHPGDKPLSEPMLVSLLTHICVTRPQWVKVWSIKLGEMSLGVRWFSQLKCLSEYVWKPKGGIVHTNVQEMGPNV